MTKSEVIKEFFKKSVLPVAVAALLYCIFKSVCTKDGVTDYVWLFILCGLPFGIPRMFAWIVPGGSLGTALPLFLLNFIIGGVIGGFVLVWRLLVAAWYIPLTIYRLWDCARKLQKLVLLCCQTEEDPTDIRYMAACAEPPQTKDSSHPPVVWAHILLSIVPANAGSRTAPESISALPAGIAFPR